MINGLNKRLRNFAKEKNIDLLGVTSADRINCLPWSYTKKLRHYMPCNATLVAPNTYDPKIILPNAVTVVIVGMYMYGFDKIKPEEPGHPRGNIGPWTRGYVQAGRYATDAVESFLEDEGYETRFTNELPYRTLAVKCGLGKIGRNGFLFSEGLGCYIRLGAVVTNAPLETVNYTTSSEDPCGRCRLCVDSCPTGALKGENDWDADMCLHLWQQGKGKYGDYIPIEERHKCGNYLMRTGKCLQVCIRNHNLVPREHFPFQVENKEDSPELIPLVLASEEEYKDLLPYNVYKYGIPYIRRDSIIALGNSKDEAAIGVLSEGLRALPEKERGLCAWALGEIKGEKAYMVLLEAEKIETGTLVRSEIQHALEACKIT
ncbi:MAG: 4Fe-4S binding protein [Treponema sp.]|jgi:epoxyqueuosine reductase|nr:4Fe-4S binding protein [Treponema sp.]